MHWNRLNFLELSQRTLCILRLFNYGLSLNALAQYLWREPETCSKVLDLLIEDRVVEKKEGPTESLFSIIPSQLNEVDCKLQSAFTEHAALGELYFAYGSNLNPHRMEKRGIKPRFLARAKTNNFSLAFFNNSKDEPGVAGLLNHTGAESEGVLYLVTDEELLTLDFFERVPNIYTRYPCLISVTLGNNGRVFIPRLLVTTYQILYQTQSLPEKSYLEHLIKGSGFWGLSEGSISYLENHPTFEAKRNTSSSMRYKSRSRNRKHT